MRNLHPLLVGLGCIGLTAPQAPPESLYFLPADRVSVRVMNEVPPVELAPGIQVRTVVGPTGSFSIAELHSGTVAPLHHHAREQADIGIDGTLEMRLGSRVEALEPGAGVVVPPNVAHSIANRRSGTGTVIEFHTVRRPDLVPPRPAMRFPASARAVTIPERQRLVTRFDNLGNALQTIQGQTCTLRWRRLLSGAPAIEVHSTSPNAELFVYIINGAADLFASGTVHRVRSGSLIVVPGTERRVSLRAENGNTATLAEFVPGRD